MCDSFIDDNDDLAVATCHMPLGTWAACHFLLSTFHLAAQRRSKTLRRTVCRVSCMQNSLNLFVAARDRFA